MRHFHADCRTAPRVLRLAEPLAKGRSAATSTRTSAASNFRILALLACCLPIFAAAGCGYTLGSPYSAEIRTVHVPTFTTTSNRRGFEFQLTEAVQKQIQQRSHFRLVKADQADTRLTGRIIDTSKRVVGQTGNSDPRQLQLNLQVEVTWEDVRTGEILRQQNVPISPEALQLAAQSEFAPEIGQSLATGTNDAVKALARNIVDMMEAPWDVGPIER